MLYTGNNTFKIENYPNLIQFNLDEESKLKGITISRPDYTSKKLELNLSQVRTPQTELVEIFTENKFEKARSLFKKLKLMYPDYNFEENLNTLGYHFYNKKQTALSLQVFALNCSEYPRSANVYDSLGEIYEATENLDLAKQNYQKSLDLNPKNENARQMISKINARLNIR